MKVLHVYSGNRFGGVETLLLTLARHQTVELQSSFALCFEGQLAAELRSLGATVHRLGAVRMRYPWTVWRAQRQLVRLLRTQPIDVVICHSCWSQALLGGVVKRRQMPLVFWCHDIPNGTHWLERLARRVLPNLAIANSEYALCHLPILYPAVASVCLAPPVPPPTGWGNDVRFLVRRELQAEEEAIVLVQVGRLDPLKGHARLLHALAQLRHLPQWTCWIVGGAQRSPEAAYQIGLQTLARQLAIAHRVKFAGHRRDISRILAAADVYVQPNVFPESFGISFVEALYAGLPVVTTAFGGALDSVDDSCGVLIPPDGDEALVQALRSLIENHSYRRSLAIAGPLRAAHLCQPERQLTLLYHALLPLVQPSSAASAPVHPMPNQT